MAHFGNATEYALHTLLFLIATPNEQPIGVRDLAEFQQLSQTFIAKILTRLERARIVAASEGAGGGYRLARPAEQITMLDVVDAVEGKKPLFECQQIRERCALFENGAPEWVQQGLCTIHAAMLEAERQMRASLAAQTLAEIAATVGTKIPEVFKEEADSWFALRRSTRRKRNITMVAGEEPA